MKNYEKDEEKEKGMKRTTKNEKGRIRSKKIKNYVKNEKRRKRRNN